MSDDSMERRIDMGELPVGGVVPTESQMDRIDRLIDTGQRSHAGATMLVLGVMPNKVFSDDLEQSGFKETEEPVDIVEPDHETRMAGLINAYRLDIGLGPKRAELASTKGDDRLKLEREINRDKRRRDNFMISGCIACPNHGNCDIEKKGWTNGMKEVHPHLKPNGFGIIYETEPLDEMIRRLVSNPDGHCDQSKEEAQTQEAIETAEVGGETGVQEDANFDIRNIHLKNASKALTERNKVGAFLTRKNPVNREKYEEIEGQHQIEFKDELKQACVLCSHQGDCALASDPAAWDEAKHYASAPSKEWENAVGENGVKHESRKNHQKRLDDDPQAHCVPPIEKAIQPAQKLPKVA